ncbi:MAG: prepilin-type N-terminal cleavage/methylation domain-containing protein [Proteobacteria bacterium]|nr:prepilin-type N-terminal cleavage/methylation domain-containing protein [Pseudomonadota bacterium]
MRQRSSTVTRKARGFTLIELLIAVVVIGILAAIAFPSFMGSIRKSRRSEAFTALAAIQQAQERWRSNNAAYATNLTAALPTGLGIVSPTTGGYYTLSLDNVTEKSYDAIATAVSGTSQAADGDCAKLGVRLSGGNLTYASSNGDPLNYVAIDKCWVR